MFTTIVNKIKKRKKKSISIRNPNFETTTLDAITIKDHLSYFTKFRLPSNIAQYINTCLIFYKVHINNSIITLDIEFNLWVFICLESYEFSQTLVIHNAKSFL